MKFLLLLHQSVHLIVHVIDVTVQPVVLLIVFTVLLTDLDDVVGPRLLLYLLKQLIVASQL